MTRIIDDVKLDYKDVLLMPKRSELDSRSKVTLTRTYKFKHSEITYTGIPILAANMDHTGTMRMADALIDPRLGVALHKFYTIDQLVAYFKRANNPHTFYSMGITDDDYDKFRKVWIALDEEKLKYICIDVANGYSRKFVAYVEKVREQFPNVVIMAGNVVTPDMTYDLLERGTDIVKIGIGPGSVCTTRKLTGVGYPQLSAILECADAAHGANGLICADGGITEPGDVAKAFAAGADFVMCGGLFAGHTECSGSVPRGKIKQSATNALDAAFGQYRTNHNEFQMITLPSGKTYVVDFTGTTYALTPEAAIRQIIDKLPEECFETVPQTTMKFYGMSSQEAMDKHYGGKADYRASEGKAVDVPYKGPVADTVEEILGGLRSTCTYVGASTLKQLPKCATYVKVNRILNDKFE